MIQLNIKEIEKVDLPLELPIIFMLGLLKTPRLLGLYA